MKGTRNSYWLSYLQNLRLLWVMNHLLHKSWDDPPSTPPNPPLRTMKMPYCWLVRSSCKTSWYMVVMPLWNQGFRHSFGGFLAGNQNWINRLSIFLWVNLLIGLPKGTSPGIPGIPGSFSSPKCCIQRHHRLVGAPRPMAIAVHFHKHWWQRWVASDPPGVPSIHGLQPPWKIPHELEFVPFQ